MNQARILLVEDDQFLRKASEVSLRKRGFTVFTAADGEEALQQARIGAPDLIPLDLLMPKLSGIQVLEALKQDEGMRNIPVIILSNSSVDLDMKKAANLGAVGYLVKANLSLQELCDRVLDHLGGSNDRSEANHSADRG